MCRNAITFVTDTQAKLVSLECAYHQWKEYRPFEMKSRGGGEILISLLSCSEDVTLAMPRAAKLFSFGVIAC